MIVGFSFRALNLSVSSLPVNRNPAKIFQKVRKSVLWRILLFYVLADSTNDQPDYPVPDPNLLRNGETDISVSPFTHGL